MAKVAEKGIREWGIACSLQYGDHGKQAEHPQQSGYDENCQRQRAGKQSAKLGKFHSRATRSRRMAMITPAIRVYMSRLAATGPGSSSGSMQGIFLHALWQPDDGQVTWYGPGGGLMAKKRKQRAASRSPAKLQPPELQTRLLYSPNRQATDSMWV